MFYAIRESSKGFIIHLIFDVSVLRDRIPFTVLIRIRAYLSLLHESLSAAFQLFLPSKWRRANRKLFSVKVKKSAEGIANEVGCF